MKKLDSDELFAWRKEGEKDDKEMYFLKESIEKYGILNPLIVRPVPGGVYEIISGHRRKYAAELLEY